MRVLVISDTHKKHENLKVVLERVSPVDLVIHLGDAEGYEDYIGELCGCPLEIVAGNNDFTLLCHVKRRSWQEITVCL